MPYTLRYIAVLLTFALLGCPGEGDVQSAASETCESVATRCRLETGAVGICSYDTESRLVCMSQH
ncbi:MAG: hypothetical protein ACNA8W_08670 [Bradymonadaceae bacterium]